MLSEFSKDELVQAGVKSLYMEMLNSKCPIVEKYKNMSCSYYYIVNFVRQFREQLALMESLLNTERISEMKTTFSSLLDFIYFFDDAFKN